MNRFEHFSTFVKFTILSLLMIVGSFSSVIVAQAGNSGKGEQSKLWRQVNETTVPLKPGKRAKVPDKYRVFRLNQTSLKQALAELPLERTTAARDKTVVMEMPMPDGSIQRFRMEETKVLSPELAKQYPTWKTFVGYGIDDPTAIGRFDWNKLGFHGYIETDRGIVYIDPFQKGDTANYLVFYKHEFGRPTEEFSCRTDDAMSTIIRSEIDSRVFPSAPEFSFGSSVRTYRIAIATTGEWSRNAAGPAATTPQQIRDGALAVVVTSVNRLNGIFVRELASTFQLVNPPTNNNATNIIFDDPATDPYDNSDSVAQLTVNQNTVTNRVGTANYDVGHLYGTGGGGVALNPRFVIMTQRRKDTRHATQIQATRL